MTRKEFFAVLGAFPTALLAKPTSRTVTKKYEITVQQLQMVRHYLQARDVVPASDGYFVLYYNPRTTSIAPTISTLSQRTTSGNWLDKNTQCLAGFRRKISRISHFDSPVWEGYAGNTGLWPWGITVPGERLCGSLLGTLRFLEGRNAEKD